MKRLNTARFDQDAALEFILAWCRDSAMPDKADVERLAKQVEALNAHLEAGGTLPDAWFAAGPTWDAAKGTLVVPESAIRVKVKNAQPKSQKPKGAAFLVKRRRTPKRGPVGKWETAFTAMSKGAAFAVKGKLQKRGYEFVVFHRGKRINK